MPVHYRFVVCAVLIAAGAVFAQQADIPPPPGADAVTQTIRTTLTHGLQLVAAGDFVFAENHFRAVYPPKPTMVYLDGGPAPASRRRVCYRAAEDAIAAWNEAAPGIVRFELVDKEDAADLVIHFEPDVASNREGPVKFVCGLCAANMPHDGQGVDRNGMIRVSVAQDGWGSPLHSYASLCHVIGHELGHYLGIGETSDATQLMGPDDHKGTPVTRPTAADVQRLGDMLALADRLVAVAQRKEKLPVPAAWQPPKAPSPTQVSPRPGEKAPPFGAKDLDGTEVTLEGLRGKVVLMDFWATWCGPCKADLPNFKKIVETYRPQGLAVVAVSLDTDEQKLRAFVKEQGLDWPQLFDGKGWDNAIARLYNVRAIPHSFLIGKDGVVVRRELRATAFEADLKRLLSDRN